MSTEAYVVTFRPGRARKWALLLLAYLASQCAVILPLAALGVPVHLAAITAYVIFGPYAIMRSLRIDREHRVYPREEAAVA